MSVRYAFDVDRHVLLMQYFGRTTHEQQQNLFEKIAEDFGINPFIDCLSDMSQLSASTITADQMFAQSSGIERALQSIDGPIKQALFAPTDFSFGIARMYLGFADLSEKLKIRVFDDLQVAANWMGLPEPIDEYFASRTWREFTDGPVDNPPITS